MTINIYEFTLNFSQRAHSATDIITLPIIIVSNVDFMTQDDNL